jgi:SNF2-related domain
MLKFPDFQLEDLPRLAILDGAICGWEQGLGKSIAAIALALIKRARRILLIAPDDLHQQHKESAAKFFHVHLTTLERIEQLGPMGLYRPHPDAAPPRFFITSFHNLGYNNADEWPAEMQEDGLAKTRDARMRARLYDIEQLVPAHVAARLRGEKHLDANEWFKGIGAERTYDNGLTIRCVWKPTLARMLAQHDCFDMVLVDEGTIMQADDSHLGNGVRMLNPRYRYVFTGTPIKNRVDSAFWLMKWVCGNQPGPTARFPYEGTAEAREQFANHYLQHDEFLTREEEAERAHYFKHGKSRRIKIEKRTARLCNVHRFWKITAPIILRRRKDDCGLPIVQKIVQPICIPPGRTQQEVYRFHLENPPLAARATPNKPVERRVQIGMQLTTLRIAALCPHAATLAQTVTHNSRFAPSTHLPKKSWTDLNPKMAAICAMAAKVIAQGEQVIIGSPFEPFNSALHSRLAAAGVSSVLLDGSVSAKRRGAMAARYKEGAYSVIVAGLKAMGKGHSFECAKHLFLPSKSWALDENEQFIHRVWRLNSREDVTIYTFTTRNTIDELMDADFGAKLDSAQLGLDGQLIEQVVEEVDLAKLLEKAVRNFDPLAPTIDERDMEREWEDSLKHRLTAAEAAFRLHHRHKAGAQFSVVEPPSPLTLALAARKRARQQQNAA